MITTPPDSSYDLSVTSGDTRKCVFNSVPPTTPVELVIPAGQTSVTSTPGQLPAGNYAAEASVEVTSPAMKFTGSR